MCNITSIGDSLRVVVRELGKWSAVNTINTGKKLLPLGIVSSSGTGWNRCHSCLLVSMMS
jgi:hypothetical protein